MNIQNSLNKIDKIEKNITILYDRVEETRQALEKTRQVFQETLPYAEEHWSHNPEMIKHWRKLAGL